MAWEGQEVPNGGRRDKDDFRENVAEWPRKAWDSPNGEKSLRGVGEGWGGSRDEEQGRVREGDGNVPGDNPI